jgi:hypothetical protein
MAARTPSGDRRAEALASIRASQERMAEHREAVLRSVATLRRIADKRRGRQRSSPREMISRWMSEVPSSISSSLASRIHFSTGYSRE